MRLLRREKRLGNSLWVRGSCCWAFFKSFTKVWENTLAISDPGVSSKFNTKSWEASQAVSNVTSASLKNGKRV